MVLLHNVPASIIYVPPRSSALPFFLPFKHYHGHPKAQRYGYYIFQRGEQKESQVEVYCV